MWVGRGATQPYPVKKKIVGKPPRNSAGFCGGGQGLSWAVETRKEEENPRLSNRNHVACSILLLLNASIFRVKKEAAKFSETLIKLKV
jgi:hypothetical protein